MKIKDWADDGWNDFAAECLADEPSKATLLLLKQAWLHGARTAIDKALFEVSECAPAVPPPHSLESNVLNDNQLDD
jgi:hypothetical protein